MKPYETSNERKWCFPLMRLQRFARMLMMGLPGPSGKRPGEPHHNSYGGLDNCYDGAPRAFFPEGPGSPIITVIEASITVMMGLPGPLPKRPGKAIGYWGSGARAAGRSIPNATGPARVRGLGG